MKYMEPAEQSWKRENVKLSWLEIECLRFLLYRVLEEPGAPADTQLLREEILAKLEGTIHVSASDKM